MSGEASLKHIPYEAACLLTRVGWYESWHASLKRAEKANTYRGASGKNEKDASWHKQKAAKAAEAWTASGAKWANGPQGPREGQEVVKAFLNLAKAAAEHCAARRVGLCGEESAKKAEKAEKQAEEEALAAYQRFDAALTLLKEHKDVVTGAVIDTAADLLWACGWHAANTTAEAEMEAAMQRAQEQEEEEFEDEEDEEDGEDDEGADEDSEDEQAKFGEKYPGSSDDPVEDHMDILGAQRMLHWAARRTWQGVRLHLKSNGAEDVAAAEAAVAEVAKVEAFSGSFPQGLNAVRLVLREALAGAKDPLGAAARAALTKAEACGLWVMLEVPAKGEKGEAWVKAVASAAAELPCVKGLALPGAEEKELAAKYLQAVRAGGLLPERCQVALPSPEMEEIDEEEEEIGYTDDFKALHSTKVDAATQSFLVADGNVLLEMATSIPEKAEGGPEDAQGLLDAASHAADEIQQMDLVSSWNLAVPPGIKFKSKDGPSAEYVKEYGQRMLSAVLSVDSGFFFESWDYNPKGEGDEAKMLKSCLEKGLLDFSADQQVMAPTGLKHTHTLVFLHGFTCDGYSYLSEPEYFYRVKKARKKKGGKSKKGKKEEGEEEDLDYEPIPGLRVVLPSAPTRKITAFEGEEMPSWYDYLTDLDGQGEDEYPKEDLDEVTGRIHKLLDAEAALVGGKNVFIGGASQGCSVAAHCALTYGGELGGVMLAMGHVFKDTPVTPEWVEKQVPVFVFHGGADETIPWETMAEPTYKRLSDAGVEVRMQVEEFVGHGDGEREQAWTRSFLSEIMKPKSQKAAGKKEDAKKKPAGKKK